MELEQTTHQEWVKRRILAVREQFTAFDCLNSFGHGEMVSDPGTPTQIACPFHGPDRKPSARFYPRSSSRHDYVHCFKCHESWDSIGLYAKFRGNRFMEALVELERKFRVHVPRKPDGPEIIEPTDRGSGYVSDKWSDIPRVLTIVEAKLLRMRNKCSMADYVKFCRLLDAISWDFEKLQKGTPEMSSALLKALDRMDELTLVFDLQDFPNDSTNSV